MKKNHQKSLANLNRKKKLIIAICILSIIALVITIFFSIFFTIKFNLNKQIEMFFDANTIVQYSHDPRIIYEIDSMIAKTIVTKYLINAEFRFNSKTQICQGYSFYFSNGKSSLQLYGKYFYLNGILYNPVYPEFESIEDSLYNMYKELDQYAIIIRNMEDEK